MKTKHLFYTLALSAAFAACSQEEIVSQKEIANVDLSNRPVVGNVVLNFGEAESRGTVGDRAFNDIAFVKGEDGFGARIIDVYSPLKHTVNGSVPSGCTLDHAYRNYEITNDFASSNYKYVNNGGTSWVTDALMVEGNYMFYYPYNEANLARTPNKVVLPMTQVVKPNEEDGYRNPIKDLYEGENPAIVGYAFLSATDQNATVKPELNHIFAYPQFTLVNNQTKKASFWSQAEGVDLTIEKILVKSTNFVKNYTINHEGIDKSLRDFALSVQKKNNVKWADAVVEGTWTKETGLLKTAKTADIADPKTDAKVDGTIEVLFEGGLTLEYGEEYAFNLVMPAAEYEDLENLTFTIYLSDDKMIEGEQNVDPNNYTELTYAPGKRFPTEEYNFPTNKDPYTKDTKGALGTITLKNETIVDAVAPAQIIDDVEEFEAYLASIVDNTATLKEVENITSDMKPNEFVLARNSETKVADMKIDAAVVELVKKYLAEGTVEFNKSKMEIVGGEEEVVLNQMEFNNGICFKAGNVTAQAVVASASEICGEAVVTVPANAEVSMGNVTIKDGELIVNKEGFLGLDAHKVTVTNTVVNGDVVATGKLTIGGETEENNFNGLTMNAGEVVINEDAVAMVGSSANENITAGKITVDGTLEVWSGYEVAKDVEIELNGKVDLTTHSGAKIINNGLITNNSDLEAENKKDGKIVMGDVTTTLKVSGNGGVVNNTVLAEVKVTGDNQTVYAEMDSANDMNNSNFDSSASINKIVVTGLWTISTDTKKIPETVEAIEFDGGEVYVNGGATFDISNQTVIIATDTEWNGRTTGKIITNVDKEDFNYKYLSSKGRDAKLTVGNVAVEQLGADTEQEVTIFGKTYSVSENAKFKTREWVNNGVTYTGLEEVEVSTVDDLKVLSELAESANTAEGRGMTVKLLNDINLNGKELNLNLPMWTTFDGGNNTISNVKFAGQRAGLFAYAGGCEIKNLTLKNVQSEGSQAGAFVGLAEGTTFDNCKLEGVVEIKFKSYGTENYNGVGAVCGAISGGEINVTSVNVTNADIVISAEGITYPGGKQAEDDKLVGVVYGGSRK